MNEYEAKKQARIDRLKAAADKKRRAAQALIDSADQMLSAIPLGQPILVGHHSEGRDRRFRERMGNKLHKGFETRKEADDLERRAKAAETNTAISSDNPAAVEEIKAKIAKLEAKQERYKLINRLVRKNDREGLRQIGLSDTTIDDIFTPDEMGQIGFPSYVLTNNGGNIRRLKQRIIDLEKERTRPTIEKEVAGGIRLVDNADENRIQLFFPACPIEEVRKELRSSGFRWSPTNGCWQAFRNNRARYYAERIIEKLNTQEAHT